MRGKNADFGIPKSGAEFVLSLMPDWMVRQRLDDLHAEYMKPGESLRSIAKKKGVSLNTLLRVFQAYGYKRKGWQ